MELRHLRYFVAVAEEQNVTKASARLRVAQPAVSRQVRDLEDELGVPLLERGAKSVRLTDAGRLFLTEAREVLARVDRAVATVRASGDGECGELHVGYAPSLTVQILPRALRAFQKSVPGVRVLLHDLSTQEMLVGLDEGKLHVALTVKPSRDALRTLRFTELARYAMCVALSPSHRLARSRSLSVDRIADEPLIGFSHTEFPEYLDSLRELFAPAKRTVRIAEEHDGVTSLMAAVEAGRGIALLHECVACLAGPRLKIVPLDPVPPAITVGAICRKAGNSAAVEKFIAAAGAPA